MIPTNVNLHQVSGVLELTYEDGTSFNLSAEFLRVFSPSAEVQGHSKDQAILQHGKKMVKIADIVSQGHYAIRIDFSDGHDTGIFSWQFLYELGKNHANMWEAYLKQLEEAGKSREPQFIAIGG
ncbi:MAG: DUF971 family protein [Candidatus Azotimanducaceae bacterium]|jgi:DUF971 family protein